MYRLRGFDSQLGSKGVSTVSLQVLRGFDSQLDSRGCGFDEGFLSGFLVCFCGVLGDFVKLNKNRKLFLYVEALL